MYSYLKGFFAGMEDDKIVLDVGGIGYALSAPNTVLARLPERGEELKLYVYQVVKENALELVGFSDQEQKRIYLKLLDVSGVGPKAALAILSVLSPMELLKAVAENDYKAIARANGVGPKMAQKVVLELKGKVDQTALDQMSAEESFGGGDPIYAEALQALTGLGFQPNEAKRALQNAHGTNSRELIRTALAQLGSRV